MLKIKMTVDTANLKRGNECTTVDLKDSADGHCKEPGNSCTFVSTCKINGTAEDVEWIARSSDGVTPIQITSIEKQSGSNCFSEAPCPTHPVSNIANGKTLASVETSIEEKYSIFFKVNNGEQIFELDPELKLDPQGS